MNQISIENSCDLIPKSESTSKENKPTRDRHNQRENEETFQKEPNNQAEEIKKLPEKMGSIDVKNSKIKRINNASHKINLSASKSNKSQPLAPCGIPLIAPQLMCALGDKDITKRRKILPFLQHIVHFPRHSVKTLLPLNIKRREKNIYDIHVKQNRITNETILGLLKTLKNKKLKLILMILLRRSKKYIF